MGSHLLPHRFTIGRVDSMSIMRMSMGWAADDSILLSSALVSVSIHFLPPSLPPTCHRTRPKDVIIRPFGPGSNVSFLAF